MIGFRPSWGGPLATEQTRWISLLLTADSDDGLSAGIPASSSGETVGLQRIPGLTLTELTRLNDATRREAYADRALPAELRQAWRDVYTRVFQGERGTLADRLRGDGDVPLLVRLAASDERGDPRLRSIAWEAMRGPREFSPSVALSDDIRIVRAPSSSRRTVVREVDGGVRVLGIAPPGMEYLLDALKGELEPLLEVGAVRWLSPLVGDQVTLEALRKALGRSETPHVVHFIGHGRTAAGAPELLFGRDPDGWAGVDLILQELNVRSVRETLRLIYLQCCEGAQPGSLASGAELLSTDAAAAVVAHLWQVPVGLATQLACAFYERLFTDHNVRGDVAGSLNLARRHVCASGSAASLSPVLYLRGDNSRLLHFFDVPQPLESPSSMVLPVAGTTELNAEQRLAWDRLVELNGGGWTVFLGELTDPSKRRQGHDEVRIGARDEFQLEADGPPPWLLQRAVFREDPEFVAQWWEVQIRRVSVSPEPEGSIVARLAAVGQPGVYVSLLWLPTLENALATRRPDADIVVVIFQPGLRGQMDYLSLLHRPPGDTRWRRVKGTLSEKIEFIDDLELDETFVLVRLFGGLASNGINVSPVLTEDDVLAQTRSLQHLPVSILERVRQTPIAVFGLSVLSWTSREVLRSLVAGPVQEGFVVLPEDADPDEERAWRSSRGPANAGGLDLFHYADFDAMLSTTGAGRQ